MQVTPAKVRSWRKGADGFLQWVKDVEPRIPSRKGGFEVFKPVDFQVEAVRDALAQDEAGGWLHQTICFSFPRRHSKTTLNALLVTWRFTLFGPNENIKVMANSERQTLSVGFSLVKKIILNTPFLLSQVGRENLRAYDIQHPKLQNIISAVSCNVAGLYGEKITCGWVSEIHAAASDEAMQVLASSLGDTEGSWLLVDSTVDAVGGPMHRLEQLQDAGEDPTVFVRRVEYRDLEDALEKSPPWIDRAWLKSRQKQLLPAIFKTQHLNQRSAAASNLFAMEDIRAAREVVPCPMDGEDVERIAAGRKYATGGGLDRAYFGSLHGDATIWTSVAKVADAEAGEPHFWVLNQKAILGSLGRSIKKEIARDVERYDLGNVVIEAYNAQDIATWAMEQKIPCEIIHATNTNQVPAFMELYRIVREGRLHFSHALEDLAREMETFVYELKGDKPKFGSDKWHDDRVYSLVWAVYSLRARELAVYELPDIICDSRSSHASFCYLREGDLILPCSERCEAHKRCEAMYLQHRAVRVESELTLPEFFTAMVNVSGVRSYRAI